MVDYMQEDMDGMRAEYDRWHAEAQQHAATAADDAACVHACMHVGGDVAAGLISLDTRATDTTLQPLRAQLAELERRVAAQAAQAAALRSLTADNDAKIARVLAGVVGRA